RTQICFRGYLSRSHEDPRRSRIRLGKTFELFVLSCLRDNQSCKPAPALTSNSGTIEGTLPWYRLRVQLERRQVERAGNAVSAAWRQVCEPDLVDPGEIRILDLDGGDDF